MAASLTLTTPLARSKAVPPALIVPGVIKALTRNRLHICYQRGQIPGSARMDITAHPGSAIIAFAESLTVPYPALLVHAVADAPAFLHAGDLALVVIRPGHGYQHRLAF